MLCANRYGKDSPDRSSGKESTMHKTLVEGMSLLEYMLSIFEHLRQFCLKLIVGEADRAKKNSGPIHVRRTRSLALKAAFILIAAEALKPAAALPMTMTLPLILDGPTIELPNAYFFEPTGDYFTVDVPRFDPSLGTLEKVDLFHRWVWTVGFGLDSNGEPTSILVSAEAFVFLPDNTLLTSQSSNQVLRTAGNAFAWNEGFFANTVVSLTAPNVLAQFVGTGILGLQERSDWNVQVVSGPGSSQGGANASIYNELLEVTYHYNDAVAGIPEPPVLSLVLFGLIGFAVIGYRRGQINKA